MKYAVAFLAFAVAQAFAAGPGQMTDAERAYLVSQLETTKQQVIDSLSGVTPAQWRFKAAPDRWSVAECAEHLVLAEDFIFQGAQGVLKTPAVPRPEKSNSEVDQKLTMMVTDRSHKLTAPEPIVPHDKIDTPAEAIKQFTEKRDRNIAYAKTTQDDLRVHVGPGPAGPMDSYQFLLLLSAHSARHTAQIREVQASPGYPKAAASLR